MGSPRARWPALADGIYAIVDTSLSPDPVGFAQALIAGGIRVIQLRAKGGVDRAQLRALVACAHAGGALAIVNDDVEAAGLADGVHLGQEDAASIDLRMLRSRFDAKIIGLSCGTGDEARAACELPVDYVGVGPMFATASKSDAGPPIGADGIAAVVQASSVPVVAIGGITAERLSDVRASGAVMAAMISALSHNGDPESAARALVTAWRAQ
jgi:thiamine-phosphate pyrophosphorylase